MKPTDGSARTTWRVRIFITVICLVAVMFVYPASVQAGNILHTRAVPAGQTIDDDVFLTGEKPYLDGTVNGDVFIVGSNVTIAGEVNGSIVIIAKTITLPGQVNGSVYAAALELTQQAESSISRSLYALVISLITEPESTIGRDLNTVTVSASLQGQTERNTMAVIGPWEIFKILQNFFNQNIKGYLPSQPTSFKNNLALTSYPAGSSHRALLRAVETVDSSALLDWLLVVLKTMVNFLVVGLLALWLFPRQFQGWVEQVKKRPLASAGYGTVVLINGYLLPLLALVLLIGAFLSLIYLSLPSLAWIFLLVALGLLITVVAIFLVAAVFLSKAIVAYMVGAFILSYVASGALRYRFIPLLLGLLIYVPLTTIPYVGFSIGLVATLLGLGAIWLSWRQTPQLVEAEANIAVPVEADAPVSTEVNTPVSMEVSETNAPAPVKTKTPVSKTKSRQSDSNKLKK